MKKQQSERAEAIARLKETLKPGDTVYTQLKHCSRSGMQRVIQLVVIEDNVPRYIGYTAAIAMADRYDRNREGIVIGGCGMNMGFALVYNLGRTLFTPWECIGKGCSANDHNNAYSANRAGQCAVCLAQLNGNSRARKFDGREFKVCSSKCAKEPWVHSDGGYALNHKWL